MVGLSTPKIQSVYSGRELDFSLLKIQQAGPYPSVPLRHDKPPVAGERCFHFGYPGKSGRGQDAVAASGAIAGNGEFSTYANCLTFSGDSGGPLFDFEGRVIGIMDRSIGLMLAHPGGWANISKILDGAISDPLRRYRELLGWGFSIRNRQAVDTRRHVENALFPRRARQGSPGDCRGFH